MNNRKRNREELNKINISESFIESCFHGKFKKAQKAFKKCPDTCIELKEFEDIPLYSCKRGYLDFVKWFDELGIIPEFDNLKEKYFTASCYSGNLELIKWIHNRLPSIDINFNNNLAFHYVIFSGSKESIEYLISLQDDTFDIHFDNQRYFKTLCRRGFLETSKWFFKTYLKPLGITESIKQVLEEILKLSCFYGNLPMSKWIYSIYPDAISITDLNSWFARNCMFGTIPVYEWLLEIFPKLDIHYCNEAPFRHACEYGNIKTAQWLYKKYPSINVSINDEEAFRNACNSGNLKLVKWLISIKPDIDITVLDHKAFRDSISNQYDDIILWFLNKFDVYKNSVILNKEFSERMTRNKIKNYFDSFNGKSPRILKFEKFVLVDEQKDCSICYDKKSCLQTECEHQYCYPCLNEWFYMKTQNQPLTFPLSQNNQFSCPMCRKLISIVNFAAVALNLSKTEKKQT